MPLIEGTELDLTLGEGHRHPDLNTKDQYLCLIHDQWYVGAFTEQWFGMSFTGWIHNPDYQYDKPGTNCSQWKRIIRIKIN